VRKIVSVFEENGRRVSRGLGCYPLKPVGDLRELVRQSAASYGDATAFLFKDGQKQVTTRSYKDLERDVDQAGTAFMDMGLQGRRIAVIGENRYEWGICYFAAVNGTGIVVPLDKYLPLVEVQNLVLRGKVEVICFSPSFFGMMQSLAEVFPDIVFICMEDLPAIPPHASRYAALPGLMERGKDLLEKGNRAFIDAPILLDALSVLLFTSGTTALSKAVMLSQRNLAENITSGTGILKAGPGDIHLSMLPLHHTFEGTVGFLFMIHSGITIAYCEGIKHIAQNIREYGVTILVTVPAIIDAMYKKVQESIRKSGKAALFAKMLILSDLLRRVGIDVRRILFKKVFEALGPRLRLAVVGAAPLDPQIVIGFDRLGLRILQGYGLTETSPMTAGTCDLLNIPGTLGVPIANVDVAIDQPDANGMGEILVRGGNVMMGYYEDEEATRESIIEGGWFRTGDLGTLSEKGILRITGRVKSMIVLGNGKKAFPEEFETMLNSIPHVKESFVWGNPAADGDVQICAKIVLDMDGIEAPDPSSAQVSQAEERTYGKLPALEEMSRLIDAGIKRLNKGIPAYKAIRYFFVTQGELIKTTTLKIKRPAEMEKIRQLLAGQGLEMRKANGRLM
jgi:long-chain acyl-CoA synthetase